MRLAQIQKQKLTWWWIPEPLRRKFGLVQRERLRIPEAFRRMLGIYEKSQLFCCHLEGFHSPRIITTIPPWSWKTTFRISVRLQNYAGQLHAIVGILASMGINVLLMEGYGYHYIEDDEERFWWNGVIDFPALHGAEKGAVRSEIRKILEKISLLPNFHETKIEQLIHVDRNELDRFCLFAQDGKLVVLVEPMNLQELRVLEASGAVPSYGVDKGAITIPVDYQKPIGSRNFLMCNTEERFIRLVEIQDSAEINLEVHTEAEASADVGVGVLATLTKILKNFRPCDSGGNPILEEDQKGVNIAFTYNYVTSYKGRRTREKSSETSTIRFFLELPSALSGRPIDAVRCCKELFRELLNARRSDGERFVISGKSELILWQYGERFKGVESEPRGVVKVGPLGRVWDWLKANKKARRVSLLVLLLLLAALSFVLEHVVGVPYAHEATITFVSAAGVALIEIVFSHS